MRACIIAFILLLTLSAQKGFTAMEFKPIKWVVYYTDKLPVETFYPYDLIIFDSKFHPPITPLTERGKQVLGYISLGEVESYRPYFKEVKAEGILLKENAHWKGSFFVDLRSPKWSERVLTDLIPAILKQGFDGVFIDTMDNPVYLEEEQPRKFKGMQKAASDLIKAIRLHFPDIKIMLNRAYKLLPEIGDDIDYVLAESIYTDYNFEDKAYELVSDKLYKEQVELLQKAQKDFSKLQIMSLDYWDSDDKKMIKQIYAVEKQNRFHPYVSTIELDKVVSGGD